MGNFGTSKVGNHSLLHERYEVEHHYHISVMWNVLNIWRFLKDAISPHEFQHFSGLSDHAPHFEFRTFNCNLFQKKNFKINRQINQLRCLALGHFVFLPCPPFSQKTVGRHCNPTMIPDFRPLLPASLLFSFHTHVKSITEARCGNLCIHAASWGAFSTKSDQFSNFKCVQVCWIAWKTSVEDQGRSGLTPPRPEKGRGGIFWKLAGPPPAALR